MNSTILAGQFDAAPVKHAAQEGWGKRHVNAKPNLDSTQSTPTPKPSSNSTVQISLF